MKKLITIAAALFASASLFAFDLDLKLGARLSDDINIYDLKCGDMDDGVDTLKPMMGFGLNVYGNIAMPFLKGLGVQPEIGFHYHNAGYVPEKGDDVEFHYMTLDIPVMVTYRIDVSDMFFIQPEIGPRFSFTLGKFVADNPSGGEDLDPKSPFNFGFEVGTGFGINVGPGSIMIDVRYVRDFTKTQVEIDVPDVAASLREGKEVLTSKDFDFGSTQSINISVGYQIRIL